MNYRQPLKLHAMSCGFPEGCSCGASEFNKMVDENAALRLALEAARSAMAHAYSGFVFLSAVTAVIDGPMPTKEEVDCAYEEADDQETKANEALLAIDQALEAKR